MASNRDYVRYSLELNLFFLRILKEHTIFAATSFPPRDLKLSSQLVLVKNRLEDLLLRAIDMSQGMLSPEVIASGELVTESTLKAEDATQFLTGVPINRSITERELGLKPGKIKEPIQEMVDRVSNLNRKIISEVKGTVAFKIKLLDNVLNCKAFSFNYPLMLHHVIEEEQFYIALLTKLEKRDTILTIQEVIEQEIAWNDIMEEHAKFIRGYLDPSEAQLFEMADGFAKRLEKLEERTKGLPQNPNLIPEITRESLDEVKKLRDFKKVGTEGILACKIKSVILPLLADHVTREANHYLRLLKTYSTIKLV